MSYRINGPTDIGDTGSLNTINGEVSLANVTSAFGDVVYADGSNNLERLAPGTAGQILQTNGVGAAPSWTTASASLGSGFSARKSGTQGGITTAATAITTWSTSTAPEYNTTGGDFNAVNGVFTASAAGTYLLSAHVGFTNTANTGDRTVQIRVNGIARYQRDWQPTCSATSTQHADIFTQLSLSIADTVDIAIFRTGGTATLTVSASPATWWAMTKLS